MGIGMSLMAGLSDRRGRAGPATDRAIRRRSETGTRPTARGRMPVLGRDRAESLAPCAATDRDTIRTMAARPPLCGKAAMAMGKPSRT